MQISIFAKIRMWHWKNTYIPNTEIERFIARDVKRTVRILSAEKIESGILLVQIKTNNILYTSKKLSRPSDFGPPIEIEILKIWQWFGAPWGGLPDGTSLAQGIIDQKSSQQADAPDPLTLHGDL